jgi:acetyl esterase
MPLDPQAAKLLELLKMLGLPPVEMLSPIAARAQVAPVRGVPQPVFRVADRQIPGSAGPLPVRVYWPEPRQTQDAPPPVVVFFHGGGWVLCNLETHDAACRGLANAAECVVVAVDYRLAPEHKFPAAVEDAFAATKWVTEHAAELGVDPLRVVVAGDSAGGNLAAAVCLMAKELGGCRPAYQVLIYPVTNYAFETASYRDNAEGYMLTRSAMIWFWDQYLARPEDGSHPYASPLRAADLSGLPPALVLTAEYDPLRDEGEAYAARLQAAGVAVQTRRYDGMIHGFLRRGDVFDRAHEMLQEIGQVLRNAFS